MKKLAHKPAQKEDLKSNEFINQTFEKKDPYPAFQEAISSLRKSPLKTIIKYEKQSFLFMFAIHITDVVISLCSALLAIQLLRSFETSQNTFRLIEAFYVNPDANQKLIFTIALAAFIFFLNVLAASLHSQKLEKEMFLAWRIPVKIMHYIYIQLLNISKKDRDRFQTGDVTNMAQNDARYLGDFFSHVFVDFPVLIVTCFLVMTIMISVVGKIAWLGFIVVCLQIPLSLFFSWLGNILHKELMLRSDKRIQLISEWIQGMRLVRYFGWGEYFKIEINKITKSEFLQDFKLTIKYCTAFALTVNWWMIVSSAIFAGILYFQDHTEASTVFAAIWLSGILGQQITPLPWFVNVLSQAIVGSKRLKDFYLSRTQEEEFKINGNLISHLSLHDSQILNQIKNKDKNIVFDVSFSVENVSLRFSDNEPYILKNINLEIEGKKTLALIGPVASGKSVLIQILMGDIVPSVGEVYTVIQVHEPLKSTIKINVHTVLGVEVLRSLQSYVPQEAFIVSATVRENVPLNYHSVDEFYDDNHIMNALYSARMGYDIENFSHKLNTEIGERGVNLSGGQKQRVSLARSAFINSSLIFLDDPLSAVDSKTEKELANNIFLNDWGKDKTIVWSTHRLDFLSHAHKIVFLDGGQIVEQGSFSELSSNKKSRLNQLILGQRS